MYKNQLMNFSFVHGINLIKSPYVKSGYLVGLCDSSLNCSPGE